MWETKGGMFMFIYPLATLASRLCVMSTGTFRLLYHMTDSLSLLGQIDKQTFPPTKFALFASPENPLALVHFLWNTSLFSCRHRDYLSNPFFWCLQWLRVPPWQFDTLSFGTCSMCIYLMFLKLLSFTTMTSKIPTVVDVDLNLNIDLRLSNSAR